MEKRKSCTLYGDIHAGATIMENSREMPKKLKEQQPYEPAIAVLDIYPKNMHSSCWEGLHSYINCSFIHNT